MTGKFFDVKATVDALGVIAAEIAELTAQEKAMKDQMAELGSGSYEGVAYRVTVSCYLKSKLNMKAVRAKLSRQFIKANTTTKPVTRVEAKARKRDEPVDVSRLQGPDGEPIPTGSKFA